MTLSGGDLLYTTNYLKAKSIIQADVPFIIGVNDYRGTSGGHAISCFGYYEDGTNSYVIVNNGWNKNWTFESYNNLNVLCFFYSRWN